MHSDVPVVHIWEWLHSSPVKKSNSPIDSSKPISECFIYSFFNRKIKIDLKINRQLAKYLNTRL